MPGLDISTTGAQIIKFIDFTLGKIENSDFIEIGSHQYTFGMDTQDVDDPKLGKKIIISNMVDIINGRSTRFSSDPQSSVANNSVVAEARGNIIILYGKIANLDYVVSTNVTGSIVGIQNETTNGVHLLKDSNLLVISFMAMDVLSNIVVSIHVPDPTFTGTLAGTAIPVGYHEIGGTSIAIASGEVLLYRKP